MTPEFDKLYAELTSAKDQNRLDESFLSKLADAADYLQKGWNSLKSKLQTVKQKAPRNYDVLTPAAEEKKREAEILVREFDQKLEGLDIEKLTPQQITQVSMDAQHVLDQVVGYINEDDIDQLERMIGDILVKRVPNAVRPFGAFTKLSRSPSGNADTGLEGAKSALRKAKEVARVRYDMHDREISWGNKLLALLFALGVASTVKFD